MLWWKLVLKNKFNFSRMKKIISIYGLPACGKTTQAKKLADEFGLYHFGMGDRIRAEIQAGTDLGQKIKAMNDAGILVPDELMAEIIEHCGDLVKDTGVTFDGFPRIVSQAKMLDEILLKASLEMDSFFYLKISREEAIDRINKRAALTGRPDDKDLDVVNNRLGVFNEQSTALLEHYRKNGKLIEIDGGKSIDEVFADICAHLK
jgi:adenylate kinase